MILGWENTGVRTDTRTNRKSKTREKRGRDSMPNEFKVGASTGGKFLSGQWDPLQAAPATGAGAHR